MANPLFNLFSNQNQVPPQNNPFGNAMQMMQQFQQFRNGFQGDPKQAVQSLLASGRMTQEQFNQLSNMAQQFQGLLGKR